MDIVGGFVGLVIAGIATIILHRLLRSSHRDRFSFPRFVWEKWQEIPLL